jgi:leader peptidase (prepilin peptidase)/N-methyltransferase
MRRSFADYDEWEARALAQHQVAGGDEGGPGERAPTTHLWIRYPHARREMLRELIFLAPCVGLGLAGAGLAVKSAGPWSVHPATGAALAGASAPLWLTVLAGAFLGFLIGGGFLWLMRIVFSLALGKEALGLGDIHLMAAVGACLGWIDATLAFFVAALVGLVWTILGALVGGKIKRAMPFGPYLAIATLLVVLCKPWIEVGLGRLMPHAAPINLP